MEKTHAPLNPTASVAPPRHDFRPSLGFPLGTAMLLAVVVVLSGLFSCCYHWEKFRRFHRRFAPLSSPASLEGEPADDDGGRSDVPSPPSKSDRFHENQKQGGRDSLPVIMPGDQIPKFVACHCPLEVPPTHPMPTLPSSPVRMVMIDVEMLSPSRRSLSPAPPSSPRSQPSHLVNICT